MPTVSMMTAAGAFFHIKSGFVSASECLADARPLAPFARRLPEKICAPIAGVAREKCRSGAAFWRCAGTP